MIALLTTRAGLVGTALLGALLFYEGVPLINSIPHLDRVPLVGTFGVGRVEIERRAATRVERALWEARVRELQDKARAMRDAKAAEIAEIERAYLLEKAGAAIQIGQLQEIINDLEQEPETGGAGGRPGIRKRLSVGLDAVGRNPVADH